MSASRFAGFPVRPAFSGLSPLSLLRSQSLQQPWRQVYHLGLPARSQARGAASKRATPLSVALLRSSLRGFTSAATPYPELPKRSLFLRAFSFVFRGVLYILVGAAMSTLVCVYLLKRSIKQQSAEKMMEITRALGSDFETRTGQKLGEISGGTAADAKAGEIWHYLLNHPAVLETEADPRYHGRHNHHKMHRVFRRANLTAGTLIGPDLMAVPPLTWADDHGESLVMVLHAGPGLCGHPGIVHGGFVATLLDEALARCCLAATPSKTAMTAYLNVDYRAPTPADSYLILRATTTKVEGRKAWVKGRLETLPPVGVEPVLLAEAEGLFVSPRGNTLVPAYGIASEGM